MAVQLPGRAERMFEPAASRMAPLIETLADRLEPVPGQRFAYFGHSLGALLAYELAREQQRRGQRTPEHLFLSGCDAPAHRQASRCLHDLDDEALIEVLHDYDGTPPEILANRELLDLLLPTVRADFALWDRHVHRGGDPLECPITVLAGNRDHCPGTPAIDGWAQETTARCDIHWFEGGHFFIHPHRDPVIDCIRRSLLASPHSFQAA